MKKTNSSWLIGLYRFGPIAMVFIFPLVLRGEYFLSLGQTICYYAMAIVGLNLLIGYSGQMSLGHSGFLAVGSYASVLLATKLGWPLWLTLPVAAVLSGLVGLMIALPAIRTRGLYLAMITVAFGFVIEVLSQRWVDLTGGPMGIYGVPVPSLFGKGVGPLGYFYLIAITWASLQWIADNLVESRWGKMLIALMHSEGAARSVGISINKQKVIVFVVSSAYTGIAGFFVAHQTGYINSDSFTIHISIFFLVALVIGGTSSRWGPLVGATLLTIIDQFLAGLYEYRFFLYGGTLLGVLILLPEGVMGVIEKRLRNYFRKKEQGSIVTDQPSPVEVESILGDRRGDGTGHDILEIRNLTRSFGGLTAVNEVDLSVRKGTIHAIIGPNGAGKTTVINLVTGNLKPDRGSIRFKGAELNAVSSHRRGVLGIARTFQNLQLVGQLTVLDNVMLGFYRHFSSGPFDYALSLPASRNEDADFRKSAVDLLRFMGIAHLAHTDAKDLPYGHQKLVEIGRALAVRPDLLLLDEAVAGLNRSEINEVYELLKLLRDMGVTILLIEHNMDFIMRISDRVSVLNFGVKIAEGSPQEVQRNEKVVEAYLGRGDMVHSLERIRQEESWSFR